MSLQQRRADGGKPQTVRETVERWLDRQRLDKADQTVAGYRGRLKHFVEWCEAEGINALAELGGWEVEAYETHRRSKGLAPITLKNELITLRQVFEYAARIGVADAALPEKIELPDVSREEEIDRTILDEDAAAALLATYRDGGRDQYHRPHAFLELAWFTGARLGGLRGLDLDDIHLDAGYVEFHHRPEQATPLKNGVDGERAVGISDDVADALRGYIDGPRPRVTDQYGRQPLFASTHGRIAENTVRTTAYYGTVPCRYRECPHGHEQATCDFFEVTGAVECPSSRSPHQIRSGSITWQLNRGIPADVVAERVNASVAIIEAHYDQADTVTKYEQRRKHHLDKLASDKETDNE